jgi:hypothetical protein
MDCIRPHLGFHGRIRFQCSYHAFIRYLVKILLTFFLTVGVCNCHPSLWTWVVFLIAETQAGGVGVPFRDLSSEHASCRHGCGRFFQLDER